MNYKKIFKSQQLRFIILRGLSFVPDSLMLKLQYKIKMNRYLCLKNPKRFTEKLQYYKAFYRDELMGQCVDKFEVRQFVKLKGLSSILNELYCVSSSFSEIDFNKLPCRFVMKTTDGGGGENVVICKDKSKLNFPKLHKQFDQWKNKKDINAGREWAYTQMKDSKIIIEKYLENEENPEAGISDYKIFCFNGKPSVIVLDIDRFIGHKRNFYTTDWINLHVSSDCPTFDREIPRPENLDEMLKVAATLSSDFPFVRVDLYNINKKIIFGEMTFYPWSGYVQFDPDKYDFIWGEEFKLPIKSNLEK